MKLTKELEQYCHDRLQEFHQIGEKRIEELQQLAFYIQRKYLLKERPVLSFICTHNSRRSQLGQIWAHAASCYYNKDLKAYSGGTESSAFNKRSVAALIRAGFIVENQSLQAEEDNPLYFVKVNEASEPIKMFSKKYDHKSNPKEAFAAIMVCSDADENCPFIPGAEKRFAIRYDDPKAFDNSDQESAMYDERCRQIAREMLYVFSFITES
jgi:arsenate reductase